MQFHNHPELASRRRKLRSALTPAEARLWTFLQNRQLCGRKFRRQHSVGQYIADFYCPEEKLVIELDGAAHDSEAVSLRDTEREAVLNRAGIRVLRIENREVFRNPDGVLALIRSHFGR